MNNQAVSQAGNPLSTAKIIYILNFVGIIIPIISIISVIIAYLADKNDSSAASHLKFQIRTFWWTLLMGVIGAVTAFFVVGIFILIFSLIYVVTRNVTGFMLLNEGKPISGTKMINIVAI